MERHILNGVRGLGRHRDAIGRNSEAVSFHVSLSFLAGNGKYSAMLMFRYPALET
jgi:hypothetical protein